MYLYVYIFICKTQKTYGKQLKYLNKYEFTMFSILI